MSEDQQDYRVSPWQIEAYLGRFPEDQREALFRKIAEDSILRQFLETREGRVMSQGLFSLLQKNLFDLYKLCCTGFEKNSDQIRTKASDLKAVHDLLLWMSNLLKEGSEEKRKAKAK